MCSLFCYFIFIIIILYLESENKQNKIYPKPLPRTRNSIKNERNVESDEAHPKPLKTIGASPKGMLTLLSFIYYCTFQLLLNQLKKLIFFISVKFTMKKKLCYIGR